MATVEDVKNYSAFELATVAEAPATPDALDSPGAKLLSDTRDALVEAWESGRFDEEDDADVISELADQAPDVYTHQRWREFVDLGAYQEESEFGEWPTDLTEAAGVALYQIAERLCLALLEELREDRDDEE